MNDFMKAVCGTYSGRSVMVITKWGEHIGPYTDATARNLVMPDCGVDMYDAETGEVIE